MGAPRIWFDPPAFSWGRVIRIGLLWLALVVVVFSLPSPQPDPPPPPAPAPTAVLPARVLAPAPARAPASVAAVPPPRAAAPRIATLPTMPGAASLPAEPAACAVARGRAAGDAARVRERIVAAVRGRGGEWPEAAALFIESGAGRSAPDSCDGAACARRVDTLARMAASTGDPHVYMLAVAACHAVAKPQPGACQGVVVERWAQLDPDNAVPWLAVATKAQQGKDPAAQAEAMHRVARASRSDSGWGQLPQLIAAHVPSDDASLPATLQLLGDVTAQEATALPSYSAALDFCRDDALRDANRRQTCAEVAEVLATRSTTVLDRAMGAALGKRLGWPADRLEALRIERDAVAQFVSTRSADPAASCDSMRRTLTWLRDMGQVGEVPAARRGIAASGRSLEAWARENPVDVARRPPPGASAPG
ncbi:MAG TPA: hypothetical protein VF169_20030 [Albitalea sp.]|uniref:hypothetical protein n=1 Tax=Piscinibacter sp. TaxID=1903157 RepID=UPI002ED560E8